METLGGLSVFFMVFLPPENGATRGLQLIGLATYSIIVPSVYLMNSSNVKSFIVDNKIFLAFVNRFHPRINQIVLVNDNGVNVHNKAV